MGLSASDCHITATHRHNAQKNTPDWTTVTSNITSRIGLRDNGRISPGCELSGIRQRCLILSMRRIASLAAILVVSFCAMPQSLQMPDVAAQRAAMKKLSFLVGDWSGQGRIFRTPGESTEIVQTEHAEYKLDGLLLVIEGLGRTKSDGHPVLQAFGIASYDDRAGAYHMRAFNDGRWLETDVKLADNGKGLSWGFNLGEIKTSSQLRINEKGEWTEVHEITIGSQPARKFMEISVKPQL